MSLDTYKSCTRFGLISRYILGLSNIVGSGPDLNLECHIFA